MSTIDYRAIGRGALAGLLVVAPVSALRVVVDRNVDHFDTSGWAPLFALGIFAAWVVAGYVAGRAAPEMRMSNGMVAGIAAFLAWLVVRVVIWAVREQHKSLFGGVHPVFTVNQLFGGLLFAAVFGLIGGVLGARLSRAPGGDGFGVDPQRDDPGPPSSNEVRQ